MGPHDGGEDGVLGGPQEEFLAPLQDGWLGGVAPDVEVGDAHTTQAQAQRWRGRQVQEIWSGYTGGGA